MELKNIEALKDEINHLEEAEELLNEIKSLKQEIRNLKTSLEILESGDNNDLSKATTNVDIIKRLSQLEKIVYGKDE